jgi:hypothetical protein
MILKITCEHCGNEFESDGFSEAEICPHCGREARAGQRGIPELPRQMQASEQAAKESVFFQSANITVTKARFVVGAKTFAMRGITSVESVKTPADYKAPFIVMVVGLGLAVGLFVGSVWWGIFGILIIAGGVALAIGLKPTFAVVLRTAGGEVTAYCSYDQDDISKIVRALNDAIISNG